MEAFTLNPAQTALVVIDLQNQVVSLQTAPYSSMLVVENTAKIATALRAKGGFIVWVRVALSPDGKDALRPVSDVSFQRPNPPPTDPTSLVARVNAQPGDHILTKKQWGAFYGTDLDLQLRRRRLTTIILTGIATCFGVESTARDAFERGYEQIFVEDAMSSLTKEEHEHAVKRIFPRMGRVRRTQDVLAAIG